MFYAGAVVQFFYAAYHLAVGGLADGLARPLDGWDRESSLWYRDLPVGSLVCALLNLERSGERFNRQVGHTLSRASPSSGSSSASGGRSTLPSAVIVLVLVLSRKVLRRSLLWILPLLLPAMIGRSW